MIGWIDSFLLNFLIEWKKLRKQKKEKKLKLKEGQKPQCKNPWQSSIVDHSLMVTACWLCCIDVSSWELLYYYGLNGLIVSHLFVFTFSFFLCMCIACVIASMYLLLGFVATVCWEYCNGQTARPLVTFTMVSKISTQ